MLHVKSELLLCPVAYGQLAPWLALNPSKHQVLEDVPLVALFVEKQRSFYLQRVVCPMLTM
jgi:hypothetical protein